MCRINGILCFDTAYVATDLLSTGIHLRDNLAHGGPDDSGSFYDEVDAIFLGHRRLSILDVTTAGHQPMVFNNWVVVYNGEIYNFKAVKERLIALGHSFQTETDTEVILKAYETWGKDSVLHFRGMFAFALWNKTTKNLILCRDRLGVKPLYYYQDENIFLFASELKGITGFPGLDLEIDHSAVSRYLQVGYIKSPFSIYKRIRKLSPGCFLEVGPNKVTQQFPYWSLENINCVKKTLKEEEVLATANQLLIENCELRMVSDVPVGVFLSGGIDSSLVSAILTKDLGFKLKTFSIGFEQKDFDESSHAKQVAQHLATDHHEWILGANDFLGALDDFYDVYDEPYGDSSGIPTYLLSKFARKEVTVALSADGGDEVFGGYDRYAIAPKVYKKAALLPAALRNSFSKFMLNADPKFVRSLYNYISGTKDNANLDWRLPKLLNLIGASSFVDCYSKSLTTVPDFTLEKLHKTDRQFSLDGEKDWINPEYLISSLGKIDAGSYLEGDILTKVDRATMAVALEGREPLLDHTLVEFGLSLPDHFKVREGKNKWILRSLLKSRIPSELIDRPKKGFGVPIHQWMTSHLKAVIVEMSNDKHFCEAFLFDASYLRSIINQYLNQSSFINPHFIWNLHMLYKWYKKNIAHA
jgi:asparagine synthase (glutamine-hydrolysing)